jgi:MFS family permease
MSLGILLSAFFWTYSVFQIGSGWLVDRVEVRSAYALAFFVWSIATLSTAAVSSFGGLLCMRLVLGIGESVGYPATSHILAATFPENRRGLANSLVDLGARLGPALGTFCGAMLVVKVGWRGLFIATGIGGLLWLVPWLIWAPRVAPQRGNGGEHKVRWKTLLTRRAVWGTVGGLCGANYAWYFLLSWLPSYLTRERGLSLSSMAVWGAMPYVAMAIASLSGGVLADRWIARGAPPVPLRRGFLVCGLITTAVLFPAVLLPGIHWALAALLVACLGFGTYASNLFALTQTLAGPEAAGRWTGLQNACGNLAGIASAVFTGWLVSKTGGFTIAFLAASAACLGGAASFWFLVREPHGYARPGSATAA